MSTWSALQTVKTALCSSNTSGERSTLLNYIALWSGKSWARSRMNRPHWNERGGSCEEGLNTQWPSRCPQHFIFRDIRWTIFLFKKKQLVRIHHSVQFHCATSPPHATDWSIPIYTWNDKCWIQNSGICLMKTENKNSPTLMISSVFVHLLISWGVAKINENHHFAYPPPPLCSLIAILKIFFYC